MTLPVGTVISPSAADGLGDCTSEQFFGSGPPNSGPRRRVRVRVIRRSGRCAIKTPALEERLTGDVYLGAPECTGATDRVPRKMPQDGNMIRLFVQVVGEGEDGIVVKLEGTGQINQQTGQITTTFENTPQLPFSEFEADAAGGRARDARQPPDVRSGARRRRI